MKKILIVAILPFFIACHKDNSSALSTTSEAKSYNVEGILLSKNHTPLQNKLLAIAQGDTASQDDATGMTDSMGYFKITYQATQQHSGLILHFWSSNYQCTYLYNLAILENIAKGQNINLGKIYTDFPY